MFHDEDIIRAFVVPRQRARLLELSRTPRGRRKFRQELAHFKHLDSRYASRIEPGRQTKQGILALLTESGAKGERSPCYVLSELDDLDGEVMPLGDALDKTVGQGVGSFVSCIPGRLAYYEGEEAGERYVLALSDAVEQSHTPAGLVPCRRKGGARR